VQCVSMSESTAVKPPLHIYRPPSAVGGVFVFKPSVETFGRPLQFAESHGSFAGGDQGLLNSFFNVWAVSDISKPLLSNYNRSISSLYTYRPAFQQSGSEAMVVHFIGTVKPWNLKYNPLAKCHLSFPALWWGALVLNVLPASSEITPKSQLSWS
uniref:Uncharacterized protein n=1 Tax=Leptobrachium leishanense TaxID=445787 RepID=A0A8C5ML54_9ANUR